MSLLALIKKGGLANVATKTPATIATFDDGQAVTVAPVATVTVATPSEPKIDPLTPDEETRILACLAHINETNQETINHIITKCRTDKNGRLYLLRRSEEVQQEYIPATFATFVTCGKCAHFERINHPHLGHCPKDKLEAIAGLWDEDERLCDCFFQL